MCITSILQFSCTHNTTSPTFTPCSIRTTSPTTSCTFSTKTLSYAYPCPTCLSAIKTLQPAYQEYVLRLSSTLSLFPSSLLIPAVRAEIEQLNKDAQAELEVVKGLKIDRTHLLKAIKMHHLNGYDAGFERDCRALGEVETALLEKIEVLKGKDAEAELRKLKVKFDGGDADAEMRDAEEFNGDVVGEQPVSLFDAAAATAFDGLFTENGNDFQAMNFDINDFEMNVDDFMADTLPPAPLPTSAPIPGTESPDSLFDSTGPTSPDSLYDTTPPGPPKSKSSNKPHTDILLPPLVPVRNSIQPSASAAPHTPTRVTAPPSRISTPATDRTKTGRVQKRKPQAADPNFLVTALAVRERRVGREERRKVRRSPRLRSR